MYAQADKANGNSSLEKKQENRTSRIESPGTKNRDATTFQLADHRPEIKRQKKLAETINKKSRSNKFSVYQRMMNLRGPAKETLANVRNKQFYLNYGPLANTNKNSESHGTSVEYNIGPRDGSYLGSSPDTTIMKHTINWLDTNLSTSGNWIRGHLLNDWLGGSGHDNENLAPMSHTTNQQWNKNFEQHMKGISEKLNSEYTYNKSSDHFLILGYLASTSGNYTPAQNQGVSIPNQFSGDFYYAAYDRKAKTLSYQDPDVSAAFKELTSSTQQSITTLEGKIVKQTAQVH